MVDERVLAQRLVSYDTSRLDGLRAAAGFVKGWLESRGIDVREHDHNGLPVILAEVGGPAAPIDRDARLDPPPARGGRDPHADPPGPSGDADCVILHGHLDVVPGREEQFEPRVEGDRLIGRGAYDMKGGLAAMMCAITDVAGQRRTRVRFVCAPDEESEEVDERSTDVLVAAGLRGDFAITGEPTDLHIGVQAKGVLAMRLEVAGRAAHGSTPWLGDNAVLKAVDVFRAIESLPFTRESSELFDRPSINLGRIHGGDALNKVPDRCVMAVDVRYLPGQGPEEILAQVGAIPGVRITRTFTRSPACVPRSNPYVRALCDAVGRHLPGDATSVGRDGASDAGSFLDAGIPAVEFGPAGGGHHGPDEWVSISSLASYRRALGDFVRSLGERGAPAARITAPAALHALEGRGA